MTKFMVSVDIATKTTDADGIARILGIAKSAASHDKGDKRGFHDTWDSSVWRMDSGLSGDLPLDEHVEKLLASVAAAIRREASHLPSDYRAVLNIGAVFNAAHCGIALRPDIVKRLGEANIGLEITAYPSSD